MFQITEIYYIVHIHSVYEVVKKAEILIDLDHDIYNCSRTPMYLGNKFVLNPF